MEGAHAFNIVCLTSGVHEVSLELVPRATATAGETLAVGAISALPFVIGGPSVEESPTGSPI